MEDKFCVRFRCGNCGHVWFECFDKGTLVSEDAECGIYIKSLETRDVRADRISCPNCGVHRKVVKEL